MRIAGSRDESEVCKGSLLVPHNLLRARPASCPEKPYSHYVGFFIEMKFNCVDDLPFRFVPLSVAELAQMDPALSCTASSGKTDRKTPTFFLDAKGKQYFNC